VDYESVRELLEDERRQQLNRGRYALAVVCTSAFRCSQQVVETAYRAQCENMLSIDQAQIDLAAGPLGILDDTARLRHQVGL
jgi:hypothetical protein